ncbi:hypothetical protein [Thermosphaera sp.]
MGRVAGINAMRRKTLSHGILSYLILVVVIFGLAVSFILSYSNVNLRYRGPFEFNSSAFLILHLELLVFAISAFVLADKAHLLALVFIFTAFLAKYLAPYYVFEGLVNYDTPIHYLSASYLRDFGLKPGYHYHSWPSWLILNNVFSVVSGLKFPVDSSIVALVSRFLILLSIYLVSRQFLSSIKALLVAMIVLLVFEPFIIHPCPQITAVALTITAIMVFLNWLHGHEHRRLYTLLILGVSVATYHAIMPIALTLYVLVVLVLYDVFPRLGVVKANASTRHGNSKMWWAATILIAVVIFYNIYITIFVTRSIIKTLELIALGGEVRLDVYPLTIENPELRWQYDVIASIGRVALLLLLGIPSAIVALSLLVKYFKSKLSATERIFFAVAVVASINALLFIVFGIILQTGLVERLYQISYLISPTLTAYLYENTTNTSPQRSSMWKSRKIISLIILIGTFAFIPLSMFTAPSYINLYADAFGKPKIATAQWIAGHLLSYEAHLDGSGRLNQLTALYLYPSYVYGVNLRITRTIELNTLKRSYTFAPGTTITTCKPLTMGAGMVQGLSDTMLSEYVENMPKHFNKVFSNSICEVFIPR